MLKFQYITVPVTEKRILHRNKNSKPDTEFPLQKQILKN